MESLITFLLLILLIWSTICIKSQKTSLKLMILGIGLMIFGAILIMIGIEIGHVYAALGLVSLLIGASKEKD